MNIHPTALQFTIFIHRLISAQLNNAQRVYLYINGTLAAGRINYELLFTK